MNAKRAGLAFGVLLTIVSLTLAVSADSFFRTVGVRIILPWTGAPFLIGVEATAGFDPLIGTAAFFLNTEGKTLITVGANLPLGEEGNPLQVAVRASTGLAFLNTSAFGPDLLLGIGATYEVSPRSPWVMGFAVEMIYPIAFPTPIITTSAGYLFP